MQTILRTVIASLCLLLKQRNLLGILARLSLFLGGRGVLLRRRLPPLLDNELVIALLLLLVIVHIDLLTATAQVALHFLQLFIYDLVCILVFIWVTQVFGIDLPSTQDKGFDLKGG